MYPACGENLEKASGMKVDFRLGAIALLETTEILRGYELLSDARLRQLEPALNGHGYPAYLIAAENSVDPELLMQAALRAASVAGIEVRARTEVRQMTSHGAQVEVIAGNDRFLAQAAVNCQGAWAGAPVRPRKGQMIYLQPNNLRLLHHVLRTPDVYLVPRSSGKILAGATVEDVGFDKTVVQETTEQLHRAAAKFVPELASAPIVASWTGLRPGTPDDLPLLGNSETPGIFIASGHFRNGILLAPITASLMADLITGKTPAMDISPFSPSRFSNVNVA
jgi:glycine oxidase